MTRQLDTELAKLVKKGQLWDSIDIILGYFTTLLIGVVAAEVGLLLLHKLVDDMFFPVLISIWILALCFATKKHITEAKLDASKWAIVEFFEKNPSYLTKKENETTPTIKN